MEVLEADERHALVRYEIGIGPTSFTFHLNKYPDPVRRRIEWQLAEGRANSMFRENSGYWQIDDASGGTMVTYAIAVRTTLPGFFTSGSERQSVVDTITSMRKLVESEAGAPPADQRTGVCRGWMTAANSSSDRQTCACDRAPKLHTRSRVSTPIASSRCTPSAT